MKALTFVWTAVKWLFSVLSPFVHDKVEPAIAAAIKAIQDEAATKAAAVKADADAQAAAVHSAAADQVAILKAGHSVQTIQDRLKADLAEAEAAHTHYLALLKADAEARTKNAVPA